MLCAVSGLLTSGGVEAIGFSRKTKQDEDDPRAHLQLIMFAFLMGNDADRNEANARKLNMKEEVSK